MLEGLAPHFIVKYAGPYEVLHKLHLVHLKVAHSTFHVLKLNFFLDDEHRLYQKQIVRPKVENVTRSGCHQT
jgi:hypothetical protein